MKLQGIALSLLPTLLVLGAGADVARKMGSRPPVVEASQVLEAGGAVQSAAWSPDGTLIAAGVMGREKGSRPGRAAKEVQLWDAGSGDCIWARPSRTGPVSAVVFSPEGRSLLAGSRQVVDRWDCASASRLRTRACDDALMFLGFSPDSRLAAISGGTDFEAQELLRGALRWRERSPGVLGLAERVLSASFSQEGKMLAIGTGVGVSVWRLLAPGRSAQLVSRLEGRVSSPAVVAFSPDGTMLAGGGGDGIITLWSLPPPGAPPKLLRQIQAHSGGVDAVTFSPDGRWLVSAGARAWDEGGGEELRVWQLPEGILRRRLVGHEARVTAIAFRPDGAELLSGSWDGTIRMWTVE